MGNNTKRYGTNKMNEYFLIKDLGKGKYEIIDKANCEDLQTAKNLFSDKLKENCLISRMVFYIK